MSLEEEKIKAKAALEAAFAAFVKLDGGDAGGAGAPSGGGEAGGGDGGGDGDAAFYFAMMEYAAKKLKGMGKKFMDPGKSEEEEVKEQGEKENKRAKPAEVSPKANAEVTGMTKEEVEKLVNAATLKVEAKFTAKLDGAESKLAAIDEEKRVAGLVEKAKTDLAGWYLSANTLTLLDRLARMDKDGKALAEHVAFHKTNVLREPPTGTRRGAPVNAPAAKDPEAVAKFSNSPDEYAKAKKGQADYEAFKARGMTMPLERFLEISMKLPTRQSPEPDATAQETQVR